MSTGLMEALGKVVTFGVILAVSVLAMAVLYGYYWAWFVVPLGLPPITFWHAAGVGLIVSTLKTPSNEEPLPIQVMFKRALRAWVGTVMWLGIGFAVHMLMGLS